MDDTSLAIIELNDAGIICHYREQQIFSPGYALVTEHGITTGTQARAHAWLKPQHSFNQYWIQLGMAPLNSKNIHARHYADLAYAQLQQLLQQVSETSGMPENSILCVPGNLSHDQLAILLGLTKACGLEVTGLIDSAVCAVASSPSFDNPVANKRFNIVDVVHVDIHLHHAIVTTLTCEAAHNDLPHIRRNSVSPLPGLGLKNFEDDWVHAITNRFIEEYRYDPLHTAAGEQSLRDQLGDWIKALQTQSEITIGLTTPTGERRLNMDRNFFIEAGRKKLDVLNEVITRTLNQHTSPAVPTHTEGRASLFISHRLALLPGINEQLAHFITLPAESLLDGCLRHQNTIHHHQNPITLVTALPIDNAKVEPNKSLASNKPEENKATHLLYQHQAYAINHGLSLHVHTDGLVITVLDPQANVSPNSSAENSFENITLLIKDGNLQLTNHKDINCSGDTNALKSGDTFSVNNITLELIQVLK